MAGAKPLSRATARKGRHWRGGRERDTRPPGKDGSAATRAVYLPGQPPRSAPCADVARRAPAGAFCEAGGRRWRRASGAAGAAL